MYEPIVPSGLTIGGLSLYIENSPERGAVTEALRKLRDTISPPVWGVAEENPLHDGLTCGDCHIFAINESGDGAFLCPHNGFASVSDAKSVACVKIVDPQLQCDVPCTPDDESAPGVNRAIVTAWNIPDTNKWGARLECGHEMVFDHDITKVGAVTACDQCEEEATECPTTS